MSKLHTLGIKFTPHTRFRYHSTSPPSQIWTLPRWQCCKRQRGKTFYKLRLHFGVNFTANQDAYVLLLDVTRNMQYIWVDRMYRVQTAAYSRYKNGIYNQRHVRNETRNENQTKLKSNATIAFHVFTGDYFLIRLVQKLKAILFKSNGEIIRKTKLTWKTIIGGSEFCQCQKNYIYFFCYRWKMKNKNNVKMFSIKFNWIVNGLAAKQMKINHLGASSKQFQFWSISLHLIGTHRATYLCGSFCLVYIIRYFIYVYACLWNCQLWISLRNSLS